MDAAEVVAVAAGTVEVVAEAGEDTREAEEWEVVTLEAVVDNQVAVTSEGDNLAVVMLVAASLPEVMSAGDNLRADNLAEVSSTADIRMVRWAALTSMEDRRGQCRGVDNRPISIVLLRSVPTPAGNSKASMADLGDSVREWVQLASRLVVRNWGGTVITTEDLPSRGGSELALDLAEAVEHHSPTDKPTDLADARWVATQSMSTTTSSISRIAVTNHRTTVTRNIAVIGMGITAAAMAEDMGSGDSVPAWALDSVPVLATDY